MLKILRQNTIKQLYLLGLAVSTPIRTNFLQTTKGHYSIPEVNIDFFGDGRDTKPKSTVKELQTKCKEIGVGMVAKVLRYKTTL